MSATRWKCCRRCCSTPGSITRALRASQTQAGGPAEALVDVGRRLAVLGTGLMDLYTEGTCPRELSAWLIDELRRIDRLTPERFHAWVLEADDYVVFTHPADGSRWCCAPASWLIGTSTCTCRRTPHTVRVRANVLKTAFLALVHVGIHGGDPLDRGVLNAVRRDLLGLSPLGSDPVGEAGLGRRSCC
ncbi:MAG: hypothetical protein U0736_09250 [Gemmataceae bacterium]